MSRIRYFRTDPDESGHQEFFALSGTEHPKQRHKLASLTTHLSAQFIPHFSTSEADYQGHPMGTVSKQLGTGLHPDYIQNIANEAKKDPQQHSFERDLYLLGRNDTNPSLRSYLVEQLQEEPKLFPDKLFTEKKQLTITGLFSHPKMTAHAMTLGAIAMNQHGVAQITPHADLSRYSSKLAQHAHQLGIISPNPNNPNMEATNETDFSTNKMTISQKEVRRMEAGTSTELPIHVNEIPPHEVAQARQTMRQILRGNRPAPAPKKNLSPQFDHPKLPGLEGF